MKLINDYENKPVSNEANYKYIELKQEIMLLFGQIPLEYKLLVDYYEPPAFGGKYICQFDMAYMIFTAISSLENYKSKYRDLQLLQLLRTPIYEVLMRLRSHTEMQIGLLIKI